MSTAHAHDRTTTPRIVVIGADGPLGEAVVRDALLRSLDVVSAGEDPSGMVRLAPSQQLIAIDPGDPVGLLDALTSASAVVLALEPDHSGGPSRHDPTELVTGVVRTMRRLGIERLVSSSSLALHGEASAPVIDRGLRRAVHEISRELRGAADPARHLRDLRRCEILLDGSGTDWTVLRAGRTTDLLGTRRPRLLDPTAAVEDPGAREIPREDLARALVDQALTTGDPSARVRAVAVDG